MDSPYDFKGAYPMDIYEGDEYFPYSVVLEVTLACNMRCLHCGSSATEKNRDGELSYEEWLKIIDDLNTLNAHCITFSGGEPFMYPRWRDLLKYMNETRKNIKDARTCIISNGSLIKEKDVVFMKENGLHHLAISLDGDEKTHDYIRQSPGSFAKVMETVRHCQKHDLFTSAVVSINRHNFDIREDIIKALVENGVKKCQVQIVNSFGRAGEFRESILISPRDYVRLIDDLCRWQVKYKKHIDIYAADSLGYCYGNAEKALRDAEWSGCSAGRYCLGIEANGNINGCLSCQDDFFLAGNARERSVIDIWNDENSFAYNRKYDTSKMTGKCGSCDKKEQCKAGCLGMAYSLGKTIYENPYCYKAITGN